MLVAFAATTLLAGCGHGSAGPAVASVASSSSSASASTSSSASDPTYSKELAYAACIRNHGVPNFPDPKPGGGFNQTNNPNDPAQLAAQRACAGLLPAGQQNQTTGGNFTPAQVAQLLKYAQCMRAHGILNFPDPTSKGMGSLGDIDPNSSQFAAASQACQSLLPHTGGNGPVTR